MAALAPVWPDHWPTDVPSPVQHADGRWLSPVTLEPICLAHDITPADLLFRTGKGYGRGRWVCSRCDRVATPQPTARRSAARAPAPEPLVLAAGNDKADRSPFAMTRTMLERHWGLPYGSWTRQHHQAHNIVMYRALGWGDEARLRPVEPSRRYRLPGSRPR